MNRFNSLPNSMPTALLAAGAVEAGETGSDFAKQTVGQIFNVTAPAQAPEVNHGP